MENEMYNVAVKLISQVGFPIFVALYVLFRLEKSIKENTKAITSMLQVVKTICKK